MTVIGIDPGKKVCGICVIENKDNIIDKKIISSENLPEILQKYKNDFPDAVVVCGNSFGSDILFDAEGKKNIIFADETNSTMLAKKLYWQEHKKPWWGFFLPYSMLTPPERCDDYAAIIIAKRYIKKTL